MRFSLPSSIIESPNIICFDKKQIIFLFSFFTIANLSFAQSGWGTYQKLYSDSKITVLVSFRIKDACEQNESFKASTFKYRITGDFRNYEYYLNWKLDYIDCNGNLYYQQNSLNIGSDSKAGSGTVDNMGYSPQDVEFTCKSLENPFYEVDVSYTSKKGGGLRSLPFSKDPETIIGDKNIYLGDKSTLSVQGGLLGIGAKWVWYEGECGKNQIGTGESVSVSPLETTSYFVRAESSKNITNCAKISVNVSQLSVDPEDVVGKNKICKGEKTTLYVQGGRLGLDAQWVWYRKDCGFNEVGRGTSVDVLPIETTTYYVRAEGKLNQTSCLEKEVSVYEKSISPVSISTSKITCANEPVTLTVNGGKLSNEAKWVWYVGDYCEDGKRIGTGLTLTEVPLTEKKYYVRGEGGCNLTNCISVNVKPDEVSVAPIFIEQKEVNSDKVYLSVYGGYLGKNASWKWYKNDFKGRPIDKGNILIVNPKKPTTYCVRAEGTCNTTTGVYKLFTPTKIYKFTPVYYSRKQFDIAPKTIQIGGGLGIEFNSLAANTSTISRTSNNSYPYTTISDTINEDTYILGMGFKGEFMFHPIIKDYFSIGLFANGAVGSTPYIFAGGKKAGLISGNTEQQKYLYYRLDVGTEIAAGYSKVKALVVYKSSMQRHTFSSRTIESLYDETDRSLNFDKQIRRETISIGIRTAPYSVKNERYKRGFCFDFLYHLSRDYEWDWDNAKWNYNALSGFNSGAGMAIWVQSVLKFQLDLLFNSALGSYRAGSNTSVQLSLIYNRNAFY